MKQSEGFIRLVPSAITLVTMFFSFWLLSLAMKSLPLGTVYTIWTGIGAVGTFVVGIVFLGEHLSVMRVLAAAFIVGGLVLMKIFTPSSLISTVNRSRISYSGHRFLPNLRAENRRLAFILKIPCQLGLCNTSFSHQPVLPLGGQNLELLQKCVSTRFFDYPKNTVMIFQVVWMRRYSVSSKVFFCCTQNMVYL